ncbi:MAG: diguanylate cyclase [Desulfobacterales bacterium]|nr:diguanylate cyclase [Desulfobacterales bacterium]
MFRFLQRIARDDIEADAAKLAVLEKRLDAYGVAIQTLLVLLKDFAMDISDIDAPAFRDAIDRFSQNFFEKKAAKRIHSCLNREKEAIASYIDQQKEVLEARDQELRKIIDLLSRAMADINSENDAYHQQILQQGETIEQITRLDDIRKIKSALEKEVESLRQTVQAKQADEQTRIQSLSSQVETLQEELLSAKEESMRDGLTGVYNRRAFDRHINDLVDQNLVRRTGFAVLLLDIDDFKRINDTYGHPVGDRVILALANACRQVIRSDDYLARYGGEEFVLLLPGASRRNAVKKARHLCQSIAKTHYTLNDENADLTLSITVSIGVSAFVRDDSVDELLERADKALYKAKAGGKNRVEAL